MANGTTLAATSGTFTSPNYPNAYYDDWRSWWSASAADGQIFRITFTDFSVEDWFDELTVIGDGPFFFFFCLLFILSVARNKKH